MGNQEMQNFRNNYNRFNNNFMGGGRQNQQMNTQLPPNYICQRCGIPGHHIRDCKTNSDNYYDQVPNNGIPQSEIWNTIISDKAFQLKRGQIIKSLLLQDEIYDNDRVYGHKDEKEKTPDAEQTSKE